MSELYRAKARIAELEAEVERLRQITTDGMNDVVSSGVEIERQHAEIARLRAVGEQAREALKRAEPILVLADELCIKVDEEADDIGGHRTTLEIIQDIGPQIDRARHEADVALALDFAEGQPRPPDWRTLKAENAIAALVKTLREDDGAVEAMTDAMTPADYPAPPDWAGDKAEAISHQRDRKRLQALCDYLEREGTR